MNMTVMGTVVVAVIMDADILYRLLQGTSWSS